MKKYPWVRIKNNKIKSPICLLPTLQAPQVWEGFQLCTRGGDSPSPPHAIALWALPKPFRKAHRPSNHYWCIPQAPCVLNQTLLCSLSSQSPEQPAPDTFYHWEGRTQPPTQAESPGPLCPMLRGLSFQSLLLGPGGLCMEGALQSISLRLEPGIRSRGRPLLPVVRCSSVLLRLICPISYTSQFSRQPHNISTVSPVRLRAQACSLLVPQPSRPISLLQILKIKLIIYLLSFVFVFMGYFLSILSSKFKIISF